MAVAAREVINPPHVLPLLLVLAGLVLDVEVSIGSVVLAVEVVSVLVEVEVEKRGFSDLGGLDGFTGAVEGTAAAEMTVVAAVVVALVVESVTRPSFSFPSVVDGSSALQ